MTVLSGVVPGRVLTSTLAKPEIGQPLLGALQLRLREGIALDERNSRRMTLSASRIPLDVDPLDMTLGPSLIEEVMLTVFFFGSRSRAVLNSTKA
jgi:hypothetical protein